METIKIKIHEHCWATQYISCDNYYKHIYYRLYVYVSCHQYITSHCHPRVASIIQLPVLDNFNSAYQWCDVDRSYVEAENEKRKGLETEDGDEELSLDISHNEELAVLGEL